MGALLGILAAIAAAVILVRSLQERRLAAAEPGGSAASAIPISQFGEIDTVVAGQRCSCRGRFALRGEGPVGTGGEIRRALIECRECGRERSLFFDLTGVEHAKGDR